jgi:menaquinone-dependent protoporphyrinogen IX oxidase
MKTLKNNPASFHYHLILKDAVINPTKAYFFNSWQCSSPDECQEYAIAILRKKFDYSDNQIVKLIKKRRINKMNNTDTNKRLICTVNI